MAKWYEEEGECRDVVVSSRVRLARNLEKYPFSERISDEQAELLVSEVNESLKDYENQDGSFYICNINTLNDVEKLAMMERHIISPLMTKKRQAMSLIMSESESTSVMVNEEDHVRIQALTGGMNLEKAFEKANEIDDITYDRLHYAYSEKYGYLTSCPTNVGTGLRASYMVFLPALSGAKQIGHLTDEVGKYGVALRGIYGEGTPGLANIYQISNQKTLGSSETDIMNNLNNIVVQIVKQERKRREFLLTNNYDEIEDQVYRSYGVLKYTKQINSKDAMTLLSQVKFGIDTKIIQFEKPFQVYEMMMAIQPYSIQCRSGKNISSKMRDKLRAAYINENLPKIK